jgi:hypothetical protein
MNEGGEKPQKGKALSRERRPLPRWNKTLKCSCVGDLRKPFGVTTGQRLSQAHERRYDESRAIAMGGQALERKKTQESIDWPVRITFVWS